MYGHELTLHPDASRSEWLRIHNDAARDYKKGEWTREVLIGTRGRRKKLFSKARGNVLDVACGYGMNFPHLINATHITGVDFSPVMLVMARDLARRLGITVDLREGDAEALDFPDDSFDTVTSALSTCSFLDPIAALREMRRVCRPDGRILLVEHGRSQWEWLGRYQDRKVAQMIARAGCHWNQEPQTLVQEAGMSILSAERSLLGVFHAIDASPAKSS